MRMTEGISRQVDAIDQTAGTDKATGVDAVDGCSVLSRALLTHCQRELGQGVGRQIDSKDGAASSEWNGLEDRIYYKFPRVMDG
jgi:hypothetical protein